MLANDDVWQRYVEGDRACAVRNDEIDVAQRADDFAARAGHAEVGVEVTRDVAHRACGFGDIHRAQCRKVEIDRTARQKAMHPILAHAFEHEGLDARECEGADDAAARVEIVDPAVGQGVEHHVQACRNDPNTAVQLVREKIVAQAGPHIAGGDEIR